MNELLERFKTKTALAKALKVSPPAVMRAFRKNVVPATWVPKLLKQGLSQEEISALPLASSAADILSALASKQDHGIDHVKTN
ncbi:hypothetical protein H9X88_21315 [Aeromonas hydrophila]|uniref:hypothetical protein n=1 Tax=Aeromonas hydrophila TaxID=644 RepID=UPI001B3A6FF9|nr:hypothetical protein [Aeromonas hydrophila]MBQ4675550.1 hypothetical protein [Aeromonas hydrophila]MBW3814691.1 hypothetical protein [Aeromonas hydrophila]MCF7680610.1 hypothetical protein [Aeromonas hydrophila]MCF7693518.1 hypothetical protein [Aeromonas hydrophila]MCF7774389.1 hypothetical protein [Aeromonas hydrophila]